MVTFTNDKAVTVKVQYRLAGVSYGGNAEADQTKAYPFDEKFVAPGETFEFDGELIGTRDMIGAPQGGGTPEDVKEPTEWSHNPDGTPVIEGNPFSNNPDPRA